MRKIDKTVLLTIIFLGAIFWSLSSIAVYRSTEDTFAMPVSRRIVLIDPGHGGFDPGKVAGQILEKDINLEISRKLQNFLELGGATVLMTRIDDQALAHSKQGDMYKRKEIANASQADIFISIHQNSFSNANVRGAQVFYYDTSNYSRSLAEHIQETLREFADPANRLQAKPNENYYVLRQTKMPAVIVESGFLTNPGERARLNRPEYQEKIAWAIYMGIVRFFEERES